MKATNIDKIGFGSDFYCFFLQLLITYIHKEQIKYFASHLSRKVIFTKSDFNLFIFFLNFAKNDQTRHTHKLNLSFRRCDTMEMVFSMKCNLLVLVQRICEVLCQALMSLLFEPAVSITNPNHICPMASLNLCRETQNHHPPIWVTVS